MSLDNEVAKFISEIPIAKATGRTYTIEEAMTVYRENYRDRIYNELRLKHIQKKIRNKILNRQCDSDKDLLFNKISIEQEIINTNISGLLSESEGEDEGEGEDEDEGYEENYKDYKDYDEDYEDEDEVNNKFHHKHQKVLKYLDLEAEQSGEESEAYEDDGSDISSLVDYHQVDENTAASIYADQKQKDDLIILKKLVGKFRKKKKEQVKEIKQVEIDDTTSEEEIFSEMPYEEIEIPKEQIRLEYAKEENLSDMKDSSIMFNKKRKM